MFFAQWSAVQRLVLPMMGHDGGKIGWRESLHCVQPVGAQQCMSLGEGSWRDLFHKSLEGVAKRWDSAMRTFQDVGYLPRQVVSILDAGV